MSVLFMWQLSWSDDLLLVASHLRLYQGPCLYMFYDYNGLQPWGSDSTLWSYSKTLRFYCVHPAMHRLTCLWLCQCRRCLGIKVVAHSSFFATHRNYCLSRTSLWFHCTLHRSTSNSSHFCVYMYCPGDNGLTVESAVPQTSGENPSRG